MRSDIELLLEAEAPPRTGPEGDHFERFVRPFALAELERRGVDRSEMRKRVRALSAELRRLPQEDLTLIAVDPDPEGLWRLAGSVLDGREPLAGAGATDAVRAGEAQTGQAPRACRARQPAGRGQAPGMTGSGAGTK